VKDAFGRSLGLGTGSLPHPKTGGASRLFEARYLSDVELAPSWEELGARYGMDQKTARDRAATVARHFRLILRRMLRNEIAFPGDEGQVTEPANDEEIRALLSPLRE
jgi:hypothetical protein